MKLARFRWHGRDRIGVLTGDEAAVLEIEGAAAPGPDMLSLIQHVAEGGRLPTPEGREIPLTEVDLQAPIVRPRRNLWCVGRNYHAHAKELSDSVFKASGPSAEQWPIVFTKVPECVVGPFDDVQLAGDVTSCVDYEAELALIIGRGGKNIRGADAMSHVFGYTIVNDVTARDVQMRHQQWDMGKSFDTFCPMGPWIVTADAFDGTQAQLRCWVNNELRQEAHTKDLIFDVPTLIETISRGITLIPGDVIATGTPAGVGMGFAPPRYLRPGDVVRIAIEGLGEIRNRFVA
jgi:2-keto-4-pentenoate hydratase/2-oxohepta-3-ene-1,7-dioic acid hydratase in catechol pathway